MKSSWKKTWLLLFSTQSLSALGSAMTQYALVLWLYETTGSALETALLSICSYAPYVLMSIFAGALSDRWNKKRTLLGCDLLAALCSAAVIVLLRTGQLRPWHMYLLNALGGLMNTVQQPAGEVASTLLIPPEAYQKTSGLRSFAQSLTTLLTPVLASALFALAGLETVIAVDLLTFAAAFGSLWLLVPIPEPPRAAGRGEKLLTAAREGLGWLRGQPLILDLIFFLAFINLVASAYTAALPALLLPRPRGGTAVLGLVNAAAGAAAMAGSVLTSLLPAPRNRVRMIVLTLFLSMGTENFLLAFGRTPAVWCLGGVLGWLPIPLMNANMDVVFRTRIPAGLQGRVFACRNTLQFFTIPLGSLLGGFLVDDVFEPLMAALPPDSLPVRLFGREGGSGAAFLFLFLGLAGVLVCAGFARRLRRDEAEETTKSAA